MNIVFEYPSWFILFCLFTGFLYSFILYRKDKKLSETSSLLVRLMFCLRFTSVSLLSFLLLSPLLKTTNRNVEKPIIIIAQDNSESIISNKDSLFYKKEYKQQLQKLADELANKYEIKTYSFADETKLLTTIDSLTFNEKQTNFSDLFEELDTRYNNRNIGAIILASDGIYNNGKNPVYVTQKTKTPIYTIALGDTTIKKDVVLAKVEHNKLAYLGNDFPLEITINAKQFKGKSSTLTISKDNNNLFSTTVNFNADIFTTTIPLALSAKEVGLQHYKIKIAPLENETSIVNNFKDIFIDVLDARQKILILADAPHPDISALKQSIEANENYEVESHTLNTFNQPLKKYNLAILHNLFNSKNTGASKIIAELKANSTPVLCFSGASAILNSDLKTMMLSSKNNEAEASLENNFSLFTMSEELNRAIKNFAPIQSPFGNYPIENNSNVLLYQRIGIVETKNPLMVFNTINENKTCLFMGEGIWRWRLQDFAINGNTNLFDELISKTVQYLSVKVDKSFFKITGKNIFLENEPIELTAEVYNESYELINNADVTIVFANKENKKFNYTFSKTNNSYRLNAGIMPIGEYSYNAKVKVGDKLYNQQGKFTISPLQIEYTNTIADHQLLYTLAQKHDGVMIYPPNMQDLIDRLNNRDDIKSISYTDNKLSDLINLKWIFFIILFLLAIEWLIRKRNGSY